MTIEIKNPANPQEIVSSYVPTDSNSLDDMVKKAHEAQREWGAMPQPTRGEKLNAFIDALSQESEAIATLMTKEMGKILTESRGEVAKALGEARMTVNRAGDALGEVLPSQQPGVTCATTRRPRGVILGINPWNFPFSTPMRKLIPSLLYGNAIILKPASLTPGAVYQICEIAARFFPQNLVQAAMGGGGMAQKLCEHSGIDGVSFTGSVGVGRRVAQAAAGHFAEISLELGGKNPAILNDTRDLDATLDQIIAAAFAVSGQRCTAISRVLIQEDIYDQAVAGLKARAEALIPMDGMQDGAKMGPLASAQQLSDVGAFVERANSEGATIEAGGIALDQDGYFYAPTILSQVTHSMEIAREEVFGPVLAALSYKDFDQAMEMANDVAYGLSSCLYSEQHDIVERFLAESESGMLHVNGGSFPQNHLPFVGVKDSAMGVGGSNGASTIQFYTTEHAIYRKATMASA